MPIVISVFIAVLALFQLFFRYDTWHSQNQDGLVYERDRLSGETHLIQPGQKIALMDRILGIYPTESRTAETSAGQHKATQTNQPSAIPPETTQKPLAPLAISQEPLSSDPITPLTITASQNTEEISKTTELITPKNVGNPKQAPLKTNTLVSAKSSDNQQAYQLNMVATAKKATNEKLNNNHEDLEIYPEPEDTRSYPYDLNHDGHREQIIQSVTANDGLLDISVTQSGKELLFTRGKQLQILPTRQSGWADLALITGKNSHKNLYRFDANRQSYILIGKVPVISPTSTQSNNKPSIAPKTAPIKTTLKTGKIANKT